MNEEILEQLKGKDTFLNYLMRELEHAEEVIYNENLSAANFIYWKARKDTLSELRDRYCEE